MWPMHWRAPEGWAVSSVAELTEMTREQAERFMGEVPFERRFHMSFIGKHGGFEPIPVYTLREFVHLGGSGNAVLSMAALASFIEDASGDVELAEAVRAAADDELPLYEQGRIAVALVAQRLAQAEALLAPVEEAEAVSA